MSVNSIEPAPCDALSISNPLTSPDWDSLVGSFPQSTYFHKSAWLRTLAESYKYTPYALSIGDSAEPEALLLTMEIDSWLTGKRAVTLPFSDFCSPLYRDESLLPRLIESTIEFGRERGWKFLELRGEIPPHYGQPSVQFIGHTLDLSSDEDVIFNQLSPSNRRAIRKSQSSGLECVRGNNLNDLRDFYRLVSITRRRHGLPPQPWNFFKRLHANVLEKGNGSLFLARNESSPIAGALFFHDGRSATYKYGASDGRSQALRPNNLVMWNAIKWLREIGVEELHFGRTSIANRGLAKFKASWGAKEAPINYYRLDSNSRTSLKCADRSSGWQNAVFRWTPLSVSRIAGELLYKHVG